MLLHCLSLVKVMRSSKQGMTYDNHVHASNLIDLATL